MCLSSHIFSEYLDERESSQTHPVTLLQKCCRVHTSVFFLRCLSIDNLRFRSKSPNVHSTQELYIESSQSPCTYSCIWSTMHMTCWCHFVFTWLILRDSVCSRLSSVLSPLMTSHCCCLTCPPLSSSYSACLRHRR